MSLLDNHGGVVHNSGSDFIIHISIQRVFLGDAHFIETFIYSFLLISMNINIGLETVLLDDHIYTPTCEDRQLLGH